MLSSEPTQALSRVSAAPPVFNEQLLLDQGVLNLAAKFAQAEPYPHIVIDNLFSTELLDQIVAEFDDIDANGWVSYDSHLERKLATRSNMRLPPATQRYFDTIYSGPFLRWIQKISGIENLITDPTLHGGGMHHIPQGGRFEVHVDFQKHPKTQLDNRLVLITYLNKDWKREYGGELELWAPDRSKCVAHVVPEFGRTVLFLSTLETPHGHPHAVNSPDGRARRSILGYYYTNGCTKISSRDDLTTIFVRRTKLALAEQLKWTAKRLTPPIIVDGVRAIRSAMKKRRHALPAAND